jgi:hypothetical protein
MVGPILFLKKKRSIVASSPKEKGKRRSIGLGLGGLSLVQFAPMDWPREKIYIYIYIWRRNGAQPIWILPSELESTFVNLRGSGEGETPPLNL